MNRATADNQSAQAEQEGLEPTKEWVKDLVDSIIADEFASPDLELHWLDEDDANPSGLEAVLEGRVKIGAATLNEMRDALGLDPFDNPAADRAMVLTATGYVPIEANAGGEGNGIVPIKLNASSPAGLTRGSIRPRRPMDHRLDPGTNAAAQKYSPNQPRVPAGNPDGGQWTSDGSSNFASDSRIITDATPDNNWIPGAQYTGGDEEGEGRVRGEPGEGTPAQEARLAVGEARLQDLLSQVQALDPNWKPTPGLYETVEGKIANIEAQGQETQNRLSELASIGIGRGPFAGESIPARGPNRDFTTDERHEINRVGAVTGCHTCGTNEPGTSSGNFVLDHQPPSALNSTGLNQRLYPQCISCSWLQGGWVRFLNRTRQP